VQFRILPALHISFTDRKGKEPNTTSSFTGASAVAVTEVFV
jgi:hypothetical protein